MKEDYKKILNQFTTLETQISDPEVIKDTNRFKNVSVEYNELKPIVERINDLEKKETQLKENKQIIEDNQDEDLVQLAKEEIESLTASIEQMNSVLEELTKPQDPRDKKDVILEIRAGAGGDEAALFAGDLFRMYTRYAETHGWKSVLLSSNKIGIGGFKEVVFEINGQNVYKTLKYESGVHRVQRIPETEKSGRIHTSTATVAVLPVAEDIEIEVRQEDIKMDVFRSSGPGGQSVNTTDSAVRLTHIPTGLVISCQDEKSQLQNREKAMRILKTKLLQLEEEKRAAAEREARKTQVGGGTRSEKIRTYNLPQDRITDHRIKENWHGIEKIMNGHLDDIISTLHKSELDL